MSTPRRKKVIKGAVRQIQAGDLFVHPKAQRTIVPSKLKYLIKNLDLDAVGVLIAVEAAINGTKGVWIIDGQHRLRAILHHGMSEWLLDVQVYGQELEARACDLFLKLNDRALVSTYDKFEAELAAQRPEAVGVALTTDHFGLRIQRNPGEGAIICVASLKRVYAIDGGRTLIKTLRTIGESWGHKPEAFEGKLVEGLGAFFATYDGQIDEASLTKKLAKYPGGASGVLGHAKGRRLSHRWTLTLCVKEIVKETYNVGRRGGRLGE